MAVKMKIRDRTSGKTGKAAIRAARKRFERIPEKVAKEIPSTFYPTTANLVRRFFKENYINQENWKQTSFSSSDYRRDKDKFKGRNDTFKIGSLGTFDIIHGSEVFGRRTDATLNAISSKTGTVVRSTLISDKKAMDLRLSVGIDSSKFEGGTDHNNAATGNVTHEGSGRFGNNQLAHFSHQVTPSGDKSVFVRMTRPQMISIGEYLSSVFGIAIRNVFTRRTD